MRNQFADSQLFFKSDIPDKIRFIITSRMASLFKAKCSRLLLIGAHGIYSCVPASPHTRQVFVSFSRCYRKNSAGVGLPRTDIRANEQIASSLYTRFSAKQETSLYLNKQWCNRLCTSNTNTMDSTVNCSKNGHSSPLEETSPAFTEVQIPTPWGHLAGKAILSKLFCCCSYHTLLLD